MKIAYSKTQIHWSKSQQLIVKMLTERKIYSTRFTNMEDKFAIEFLAPQQDGSKPIGIRILVQFQEESGNERKRENELNRLHRVLFYHLKAKFVAIDNGLTEFMEEFMPHLVVMDKKGNSTTLGQMMLPQYKTSVESGEQQDFKLLGN